MEDTPDWEKLSSLTDHELVKHILNELSFRLTQLGAPGKKPGQQLKKLCRKRGWPTSNSLSDDVQKLLDGRNTLVHAGQARAGLPDRDAYVNRFINVKVTLTLLADDSWRGQSKEEALENLPGAFLAERHLSLLESELSHIECFEAAALMLSADEKDLLQKQREEGLSDKGLQALSEATRLKEEALDAVARFRKTDDL